MGGGASAQTKPKNRAVSASAPAGKTAPEHRTDPADAELQSLGIPGSGLSLVYLAQHRQLPGSLIHIKQVPQACSAPLFKGSIDMFRSEHADDAKVQSRLRNKVKVCSRCGKPNAFTMKACNACSASIVETEVSFSDNILMGFVYGIAEGRFPYKISMRAQTQDCLCFDDPLAMTVCHFLSMPTSVYIADWRYLFLDPARGLQMINMLFDVAAQAALEQFWSDDAFREKYFGNDPLPSTTAKLMDSVICGFNFPPSMYQLHLQFIHPPLLPFHYGMAVQGEHFTHGRFFPFDYVREALALGDRVKMPVCEETDIAEIIRLVNMHGINYDERHAAMMRRCQVVQTRFSPWKECDFQYVVMNDKVFNLRVNGIEMDQDPKAIRKHDALAIQNYGRPYGNDGKPTGSYYKYAKKPDEVTDFKANPG